MNKLEKKCKNCLVLQERKDGSFYCTVRQIFIAEDALCDMFTPLIQDYDIEDEEWREDE